MPNTKITLYDIGAEGQMIIDALVDNEGELDPAIEQRINALMIQAPAKIESAGHVLLNLESAAAACQAESDRLRARAKMFQAGIDKLRERMTYAIDAAFGGKLKTDTATYWTQKAADSVSFDLADEVTLEQLRAARPDFVRTKLELDKAAIQAAYKAEQPLPDAIFVNKTPGRRYLRWK